jgi:hypothetical protein
MTLGVLKTGLASLLSTAAVVSVVAALIIGIGAPPFTLEVSISATKGGLAQTFYDVGKGFTEGDSFRSPLPEGILTKLEVPLPPGTYNGLRFDPLDRPNSDIVIKQVQIVDVIGRVVRKLTPGDLAPYNITRTESGAGAMRLTLGPKDNDSQLVASFNPPLTLTPSPLGPYLGFGKTFFKSFVLLFCFGVVGLLFAPSLGRFLRPSATKVQAWGRRNPGRLILLVAATSTLISCYPVVFFGKSFVSPNNGVLLLYDHLPTLPGYSSAARDDASGADIGAAAWFHVPFAVVEGRSVFHDYELPLWNRYDSCGVTLLGQGQSMFGDPLHCLVLFTGGSAWAWDLKFILAKILFAWGLGLTIHVTTRHLPASLILACSSTFIGFFPFRYDHAAIFSVSYAPWILYSWFRFRDALTHKTAAAWIGGLLLACWAEICSGTVKEAYMLLLGINGCGLLAFFLTKRVPLRWPKCGHLALGGVLFVAITAPLWWAFLVALHNSFNLYAPGAWQLQPSLTLGVFDDIFYREFISGEGACTPAVNFLIFLGVLWAVTQFKLLIKDGAFMALTACAIICWALIFGVVPSWVIAHVPFVANVTHIDNTFSCLLIIILTLMAGFGIRAYWEELDRPGWPAALTGAIFILSFLLALYFGYAQASSPHGPFFHPHELRPTPFFGWYSLSLIAGFIALPLAFRALWRDPANHFVSGIVVVLCLIIMHWRFGMYLATSFDSHVMNPAVRVDFAAKSPAIEFIRAHQAQPYRTLGLDEVLFPGYNSALELEGINGAEPLMNPFYRKLTEAWGVEKAWGWRYVFKREDSSNVRPLLDFLNVKYLLDSPEKGPLDGFSTAMTSDLSVYENKTAWPRAFFTDRISVYDDVAQVVGLIKKSNGQPFAAIERNEVVKNPQMQGLVGQSGDTVAPAFDYNLSNNTTSFKVTAPKAGVISLGECYSNGDFDVTLNGKPTSYFRVNEAFKGIAVDQAGTYDISVTYWPRGFTVALVLFGAGAAGLAAYFLFFLRLTQDKGPTINAPI